MNTNQPLTNKTILVTRPEDLAEPLLQRIREAGGTALHFPVLRICPVEDSAELSTITAHLPNFDIAIFISPTAAQKTLEKIKSLPGHLMLAVIGRSTEAMLNSLGYQAQIVPEEFTSESLLLHPALQADQIDNKSILIFRGVGGRDLLGATLTQRGASVSYAEMYRREKNTLPSLSQAQLDNIDVLTITSNEGLQNLYDLTDDASKSSLTAIPIIVPGERAYSLAAQLGFKTIIQSRNATDDACMQSIISLFTPQHQ